MLMKVDEFVERTQKELSLFAAHCKKQAGDRPMRRRECIEWAGWLNAWIAIAVAEDEAKAQGIGVDK
jgi:hypothetical protein